MLMVAVAGVEEPHRTERVRSCVLASLKVPVAVNCFVVPTAMLEFAGVTAMDTNVALLTLSEAVPVTEPESALIVVDPVPTAVARPEALTAAAPGADEVHVNEGKSCVLPSSKVPTAVNCWVVPRAIETAFGSTSIDIRCAATTVRVVVSLTDPTVAVIVVCPAPTVVACPEPLMLATGDEDELHVTPLLKSCVDPSEYVAVAVNCWLMPMASVKSTGVMEIEEIVGAVTVKVVDPVIPPMLAETLLEPGATAVTKPLTSTVATAVEADFHVTRDVRSLLLPSA